MRNSYLERGGPPLGRAFRISTQAIIILLLLVRVHSISTAGGVRDGVRSHRKCVIIVANRLTLADIDSAASSGCGHLKKLIEESSSALIGPNCIGAKTEESVMLTAACGTSARGGAFLRDFRDTSEWLQGSNRPAGREYTARTGLKSAPGSGVLLGLADALRANEESGWPITLGALGESVRKGGLKTYVVGDADIGPDRVNRLAAVIAMDSSGRIDIGSMSKWHDPFCAAPRCAVLTHRAARSLPEADLLVVNFGDSTILDETKNLYSDAALQVVRDRMLRSLDLVVGKLREASDRADCVLVLVSFSPSSDGPWKSLTPIFILRNGSRSGVLTSPATRTPGLIAASDFAPTILSLMNVSPAASMLGQSARESVGGADLRSLGDGVAVRETLITPVLASIGAVSALLLTASAVIIAFGLKVSRRVVAALRWGIVAAASTPLAMLLAAGAPATIAGALIGIATGVIVVTAVSACFRRPLLAVFAMTCIVLAFDVARGCPWCRFALPGPSQISGYRYYGIGNEYAGVLVSMSALISVFASGPGRRPWVSMVIGTLTVLLLGIGGLGANYGGALAATITFALIVTACLAGGFGARHVVGALALALATSTGLAWADWRFWGLSASHGGRSLEIVGRAGEGHILSVAARKVAMNAGIIGTRRFLNTLVAFTPFFALWFCRVQGQVRVLFDKDPRDVGSLKAIMWGAGAAFLFNDSGAVFAGLMIAMTVALLIYSLLEELACRGS